MEVPAGVINEPKTARPIEEVLTPEEISIIKQRTDTARKSRALANYIEELSNALVFRGDYQTTIEDSGIENPVPLTEEIQRYVEALLKQGVGTVNIVDFGAGGAETTCTTANRMRGLVKQGKVRFIATNLQTVPTQNDLEVLEKPIKYGSTRYKNFLLNADLGPAFLQQLKRAVSDKTVVFIKADALELYQYLKGQPIHLMFLMHTAPVTADINDVLLKLVSEMVDPRLGTAILTGDFSHGVHSRGLSGQQLFNKGLGYLEDKGFKDQWTGYTFFRPFGRIHVYQASASPKFYLSDIPDRQIAIEQAQKESRKIPPWQRFIPA